MSIPLDILLQYWRNELPAQRMEDVESALFQDAETARRLDAIARLDADIRALVASGDLQGAVTVQTIDDLTRAGLKVRSYAIEPNAVVPCSIADEDLMVIRMRGDFSKSECVDLVMDGELQGIGRVSERLEDVPIDRRSGELVLVYPGEKIRALPRSRFQYGVTSNGRQLGEFGLDHTPR